MSEPSKSLCEICTQCTAIYKCPRCAMCTCSLACSRSHKALQSCSGERDKTAYVPMNKYGWGTMADDYVFLEELGRKVVEWGNDITRGGYLESTLARGQRRGRVGRLLGRSGQGKQDILRMQLCAQDIDVEILPPGMEKRRLNRSTWDVRRNILLLTLEFIFHPVRDPLSPSNAPDPPSFRVLTHRNDMNLTLLDILRKQIAARAQKESWPLWVKSLVSETEGKVCDGTLYLIAQDVCSSSNRISKKYYKLNARQSMASCLQHKSFVEYPTVDVWEDNAYTGAFIETDGSFVEGEGTTPAKRRRLDTVGGKKMIKDLLGGYGSEEGTSNVMNMLHDYGSDQSGSESSPADKQTDAEDDQIEEVGGDEGNKDDEEFPLGDLHDILEAAGHDATLVQNRVPWTDESETDWGDSGEDEAECALT